jgi:hypothetical protein
MSFSPKFERRQMQVNGQDADFSLFYEDFFFLFGFWDIQG